MNANLDLKKWQSKIVQNGCYLIAGVGASYMHNKGNFEEYMDGIRKTVEHIIKKNEVNYIIGEDGLENNG